jgi:cellulose synthase/poly-beta-1,6-N-acetylglucosamine synthase-like glycosyltransferase
MSKHEGIAHTLGGGRACAGSTPAAVPSASPLKQQQRTVSIIIKALNEERHIASAIESALAALREIDGEVILADGGSTDRFPRLAPA